ncbi:hypothetical protein NSS64_20455 [Paenibacillus sp. FSL H8-0122]|uniref:hypothetical protein n=1 Tax=Paenibacillus sp. FSL H8-0122 TaxID=2954510 RepID=UPI0030F96AB0
MTIFWISNRNDFTDFTGHMDSAWSSGPNVVGKPTTFGATEVCEPDMVEKPTTFGAAEMCELDMVGKPTTFGAAEV